MKVKYIICTFLLIVGLISCVDDKYDFNNLDSTMQLETDLVGPLAYSSLKLVDILNTDSLGELEINIKGDTMFLVKMDSQYLGNDLIDQLQVLPSTKFNLQVPLGIISVIQPTEAEIDQILSLNFPNINTNENERLDSILMGTSNIDVIIKFPKKMKEGSYLSLEFNEDELLLNPELYPENTINIDLQNIDEQHPIVETHINLYGAMFRFGGRNSIDIHFTGYVNTEREMDISNVFEIELDCSHMKPHVTFINIGNARDIVENENEIEFDYAQDVYDTGMSLPFYDPEILMTCLNNIGVPARYYIDYVEGISSTTGEVVRAKFGEEDSTSVVLNTPSYDEIKNLTHEELLNYDINQLTKYSKLVLNREFGHTDRLFKIKVDKLRYKYRIRSVETDRHNVHFFFHDSDIETKEITKLPLWFEGDVENPDKNFRLVRKDTVNLDFSSFSLPEGTEVPENTKGILKFYYKNHLPVGVDAKLKFIDENENEIVLSTENEFLIESGEVDDLGNVIKETEPKEMLMLVLSYSELQELLSKEARVVLEYKLENENHKNIFLKSTDWLDLKIMFHLDGSLIIDPSTLKDEENQETNQEEETGEMEDEEMVEESINTPNNKNN